MKVTASGMYASFDDMCWPVPGERAGEVEWRLRYAPEALSRSDHLLAASIINAYRQMVGDPETKRRAVIRQLRLAALERPTQQHCEGQTK
jgi:hypothetical protein